MDEGPQLHHIIIPIFMTTGLGLIVGVILAWNAANKPAITVGCMMGGYFLGWWVAGWFHNRRWEWTHYEDTSSTPMPTQQAERGIVISVNIPNAGSRLIRGLKSLDEWRQLAGGIVNKNFKYTLRDLQDIFGRTDGDRIYSRVTPQLLAAGILEPSGANGVTVTEHIGKHFFTMLRDGDYQVLNTLPPSSAPESVRT